MLDIYIYREKKKLDTGSQNIRPTRATENKIKRLI